MLNEREDEEIDRVDMLPSGHVEVRRVIRRLSTGSDGVEQEVERNYWRGVVPPHAQEVLCNLVPDQSIGSIVEYWENLAPKVDF